MRFAALAIACAALTSTSAVAGEPARIVVITDHQATLPMGMPSGVHAYAAVEDAEGEDVVGALVTFTVCPPSTAILTRCVTGAEPVPTDENGWAAWDVPTSATIEPGTYTVTAQVGALTDSAEFYVLVP